MNEPLKLEKGWKVVRLFDGKMASWGVINKIRPDLGHLVYKFWHVTRPLEGCGPMCVFKDIKSVKQFLYPLYLEDVFPVLYIKSKRKRIFIKDHKDHLCSLSLKCCPKGTILADMVILLPKEKDYE